jgi:hypothetical protein
VITLAITLILALLTGTGAIDITDDPPPAAPTPTPASTPALRTLVPELAGAEHTDLAEPGDLETRAPLTAGRTGQTVTGCVSDFNQHNYSSRAGARAQLLVAHYTVSPNVPGWADVNANKTWLNTPAAKASANFIIDDEGHCAYTVPVDQKAWTQAAANPYSVSIEFVATGQERALSPAATAAGGLVFHQVATLFGIPARRGATTSDCRPARPGIIDHATLRACGGGHTDIRPFPLEPLIQATAAAGITNTDRATCRKLNYWRTHGRKPGKPLANAIRRRKALSARGVTCTANGPVRAT